MDNFEHIYVIGFGKVSCKAAFVLEQILGDNIKQGVAIGVKPTQCDFIETYEGTHPHPSVQNVELSEKIIELSKQITEKDLVLTVVSGGGSALLCWPLEECKQAQKLYEEFLPTGGDIKELNTIRKHISTLKGGGLAKELYPATVIGLVFSDIPGDHYNNVASGPTYKDESTVADAQAIIAKYGLSEYNMHETPKDDKYFEKVINIPLVSNINALEAMKRKAEHLGLKAKILSAEIYNSTADTAQKIIAAGEPGTVVLAAGEPQLKVTVKGGTGGRNQMLAMEALPLISGKDVFAAIASDGHDNGKYAGVIEDAGTVERAKQHSLDFKDFKTRFDAENFYNELGQELLETGYTDANVSDIMLYYKP